MKKIKLLTILLCGFMRMTALFSQDSSDEILINKVREEPIYSGADRTYGSDLEGEKRFSRYEWIVKEDETGHKIVKFIGTYKPEVFFSLLINDKYVKDPKGYERWTITSRIADYTNYKNEPKVLVSRKDKDFFNNLTNT